MLMYSLTMLTWLEPTGIPHGVGPAEHPPVPAGVSTVSTDTLLPATTSTRRRTSRQVVQWSHAETCLRSAEIVDTWSNITRPEPGGEEATAPEVVTREAGRDA